MRSAGRRPIALLIAGTLAAGVPAAALAAEFKSIAAPAIAYDAPSEQGRKVSILLAGTPVEIVVGLDRWVKVRDLSGAITWVQRQQIADKRTVLVNVDLITAHQEASASSPAAFRAARGVVLDLLEPPRFGWIKVRHADGDTGYARAVEVLGL